MSLLQTMEIGRLESANKYLREELAATQQKLEAAEIKLKKLAEQESVQEKCNHNWYCVAMDANDSLMKCSKCGLCGDGKGDTWMPKEALRNPKGETK